MHVDGAWPPVDSAFYIIFFSLSFFLIIFLSTSSQNGERGRLDFVRRRGFAARSDVSMSPPVWIYSKKENK